MVGILHEDGRRHESVIGDKICMDNDSRLNSLLNIIDTLALLLVTVV